MHSVRRRTSRSAFSLIEVLISLFIFALMGLMFSAVVSSSLRSYRYTGTYGHAMTIANRKIDQLLEAGFNRMNTTDLRSLGIVDTTTPTTSTDSAGNPVTTYSFTANNTASNANNPDNLTDYFPGPTSGAGKPTGTIRMEWWSEGMGTLNNVPAPMLYMATITITWKQSGGPVQTYSASTVIPRMTLN